MDTRSGHTFRTVRIVFQSNAAAITTRRATRVKSLGSRCLECQTSTLTRRAFEETPVACYGVKRHISTSRILLAETEKPTPPVASLSPHISKDNGDLNAETRDSLPSKTDERRWQASRRMAKMMDSILARASIAGQHINNYTGTDYSGIEELKKNIAEQERKVRECHKTIDQTRAANHDAHEKQDFSQKEIVALLERKSSWSPAELERYMSLVRSEHENEQAVQASKEDLTAAERDLEEVRAKLERLERRQYHEEQIWSDAIRRNSTWVTFGLMGVNIVLLLAQIAIFEPYRRKKIVKEVKIALNEMHPASPNAEVERQIDQVVEPKGVSPEVISEESAQLGGSPLQTAPPPTVQTYQGTWGGTWDAYKDSFQDLFSERIVQLKKVDVTTTALQGAATGVAAMGILFVLFRPR